MKCAGSARRRGGFAQLIVLLACGALGPRADAAQAPDSPGAAVRLGVPIIVTQIPVGKDAEKQGPLAKGMLRAPYGEGARLVLVSPDGAVRVLSQGFHSACDPDVSFDGKSLLAAGKKAAGDRWNIFEMAPDGSAPRQITQGLGDCRQPGYQSTLYTITATAPWRQITFVVTDPAAINECGSGPVTALYSARLDGSEPRRLTSNLSSDMDPAILPDGRLIYAHWQRSTLDHGLLGRIGLRTIQVDGMDSAAFSVEGGKRIKHMPCVTPPGLAVFVETDAAPWDGAGTLASVQLRRPLHTYRPLTAEGDGLFTTPSPLPDAAVLVSWRPRDGSAAHGVYRFDPATKRRELVFRDPAYHCIQAKALCSRPEPDGRSSVIDEKDPLGKLFCLDVNQGDFQARGWMPAGTIRKIRVVQGVAPVAGRGDESPAAGRVPALAPRRVLGEFSPAADGSLNLDVPAGVPLEVQALDADGLVLRACGWISARNHEPRGCLGCHEDGELVPENRQPAAAIVPSLACHPPAPEQRSIDFVRDVAPVVARKCTACHAANGSPPQLEAGPAARRAYETLLAADAAGTEAAPRGRYVDPGRARTSRLAWHLFGRNTARAWDGAAAKESAKPIPPGKAEALTPEERDLFVKWIDLGAVWQADAGAP